MILQLKTDYRPRHRIPIQRSKCCPRPRLLLSVKSYDPKHKFVQCQRCMTVIMRRVK